jgi:HEPN domain-containing protein
MSKELMPRVIPFSAYTPRKMRAVRVFKLDATPKSSPIDINLPALIHESGWNLSDRLRFWHSLAGTVPHTGLTIRKLDLEEKALVHCRIDPDGALSILSNNREYATGFFRTVFLNSPPTFAGARNWKVTSGWIADKTTLAFFAGLVAGALGWGPKVPHEIETSLSEALDNLRRGNWKSCVVMCRRALQALMELAYEKQFGTKPGRLDLNTITRRFEALTPLPIPRHWLNIADSVRNIGNVPGAHPRTIPGYRFSKRDAELAYINTSSFVAAYLEKIAGPTI